ncbi:hypothetical protein RchiOBHm_Chr4g0394931 [Rosa chinensis]|uniref:Uncharacterized protein n=1 Tax=Rosa chinensis TaxID=74649 RepID=A0A2P6QRC6_ROSCH|nr:hypothetical protein RchiOBHm_Chr4g0394931 [Rosa chinensis]
MYSTFSTSILHCLCHLFYLLLSSILLEEGGTMFTFEGSKKDCSLKSVLIVHSPQFYWKVMTQADLGITDAYINCDFSFHDKDRGLLNLLMVRQLNINCNLILLIMQILIKFCLAVSSSSFSLPTKILMPQNQTRKGAMHRLSQTRIVI